MARVCQRKRRHASLVGSAPSLATGDAWLAQLEPRVGSEIQKTQPCVVILPPELHQHLRTVIVAPMTTGPRLAAFRVLIIFKREIGLILLYQIRTLDKCTWFAAKAR